MKQTWRRMKRRRKWQNATWRRRWTKKDKATDKEKKKKRRGKSESREEENLSYYVVSESLSLLLSEALTEALDELVQFLSVAAEKLPDVVHALQAVGGRRAELGRARVHLHGPGDAQDAVALLLVVVKGFVKQDGDRRRRREAGSQQDLPVLDPDLLQHTRQHFRWTGAGITQVWKLWRDTDETATRSCLFSHFSFEKLVD